MRYALLAAVMTIYLLGCESGKPTGRKIGGELDAKVDSGYLEISLQEGKWYKPLSEIEVTINREASNGGFKAKPIFRYPEKDILKPGGKLKMNLLTFGDRDGQRFDLSKFKIIKITINAKIEGAPAYWEANYQ